MEAIAEQLFFTLFNTKIPRVLLKADDPDFTIVIYNEAYEKVTYLEGRDITGISLWEAFDPANAGGDGAKLLMDALVTASKNNKPVHMPSFKYDIPSGHPGINVQSWWQLEIIPVSGPGRAASYLLTTINNVTDQIENSTAILDSKLREETLNEQLEAINKELASTNEELQLTNSELNNLNEKLTRSENDFRMLNAELEERVIARTQSLKESYAQQQALTEELVTSTEEITASNEELLRINEELRISKQQKDEFLSIASHELRTPLTTIKAYNQLMQLTKDEVKRDRLIIRTAESVERLERLINNLLDVSKISENKMLYEKEPFDLKKLVTECVENANDRYPTHEIILEQVAEITYTGDRFRLEQVIQNLLSNAVKYSPEANRVLVNSWMEQYSLIVSVRDFGIGIAASDRDKLFERYFRVDHPTMRIEGLGLGLFISSEILKEHNGICWIESEIGKGSVFYFRLPISN